MGNPAGEPQYEKADRQEEPSQPVLTGQLGAEQLLSLPRHSAKLHSRRTVSLLKSGLLGPIQASLILLMIAVSIAIGASVTFLYTRLPNFHTELNILVILLLVAALLDVGLLFSASLRHALDRKIIKRIALLQDRIQHIRQGDVEISGEQEQADEIGQVAIAVDELMDLWVQRQSEYQEEALDLRRQVNKLRQVEADLNQQNEVLNQRMVESNLELQAEIQRREKMEANLRSNLNMTMLLYHIIATTTSTLDPQKALEALCRELAVALDLPQAAYAELSPDRECLKVTAEYRQEGRPSACGMVIPVKGNPATMQAIQTKQPVVVKNAQEDSRQEVIHDLERQRGTISLLIVPIVVRGEVIGTLGLDALHERDFTPEEISLVQNCATGLAQALENLYLYNALQNELAERNRVEQELRDSEARYRQSVENLPNPIFIVDHFGTIKTWSRTCERILQHGQEVIGLDFAALLAQPQDREQLGVFVRQAFELRKIANDVEVLYLCKDGTTRFMVSRLYPLFDRDGQVSGCVFASTDLTDRKRDEDEIRRRTLQLEVLRKASLELTAELDLETLLYRIANRSRELLGAERSGIYLYEKNTDTLEFRVRSGEGSPPLGMALRRGEGISGRVLETRTPLMVDDYSTWEGRSTQMDSYPSGAMIGVPVSWRDEMLGVLTVSSTTSYRFTRSDIEMLGLFAHQAAIAIRNARVMNAEARQRRRAEAMARTAAELSSTLELQPLLEIAVRSVAMAFPQADFGMILMHPLMAESAQNLAIASQLSFAVMGISLAGLDEHGWTDVRLGEIEQTWKHVFLEGVPVLIPDLQSAGSLANIGIESLSRLQSAIGAPLKVRDQVKGVLWLGSSKGNGTFQEDDVSLLEALANQTAIAVVNADLYRQARVSEDALRYDALHDPLTDLPNRIYFQDKLRLSIERARRSYRQTAVLQAAKSSKQVDTPILPRQSAILFLDLDRFKIVNDSLGHAAGDKLLIEVARRLSKSLRPGDIVARFGGDEFAVLLENIQEEVEASQAAARILLEMADPISVNHQEVLTTASIGISLTGGGKRSADEMLREADIAMYYAKANGKARYEFYRPEMGLETVTTLELETDLRRALSEHELRLVYQPVIDLHSGQRVEMEELLRWEHPKRGLLLPEEFLPAAIETGLIGQIGKWVVREALQQQRLWSQDGKALPVAVNIPTRQLENESILNQVENILAEAGLAPGSLVLDVAEPNNEQECERLGLILGRLRQAGIWINLEHFGSGSSSLAILKRLPIDGIKIPRGLVRDLPGDDRDRSIVEALVKMGHGLGLVVTAVGVETELQAECLRTLACDRAQGKWASDPIVPELV